MNKIGDTNRTDEIINRVMSDPKKHAPTIIGNAKEFGVRGFPKFIVDMLLPKIEKNLDEYVQKLPSLDPQRVRNFIEKNPKIFEGVKRTTPSPSLFS